MNQQNTYTISFAGLIIKFVLPTEVIWGKDVSSFLCKTERKSEVEYEIKLLNQSLNIKKQSIASYMGLEVYPYSKGWLRVYTFLEEDGCQVACYLNPKRKNILYYPASKWAFYAENFRCMHLIGIENILLQFDAFLLHSSLVQIHGQTVLFSGPSGIGKSTQAMLWQQYLGAEILNGDRCVVRKIEDVFYGCGSPWAGTSGIYRTEYSPIKGIFLLGQSDTNTVRQIKIEAFTRIFHQCIVNTWDYAFVVKLTDLIAELLERVPVYELSCRPDEEAVQLAYNTLFKKEELL